MIALQPIEPPPATFEEIYADHHRAVVRYVALMLRDPDDAADVAAETFARAFDAWSDGRKSAGRPTPPLMHPPRVALAGPVGQ